MLVDRERMFVWCEKPGCHAQRYPGKRWCYRHWMRRLNTLGVLGLLGFFLLAWAFQAFWGVS